MLGPSPLPPLDSLQQQHVLLWMDQPSEQDTALQVLTIRWRIRCCPRCRGSARSVLGKNKFSSLAPCHSSHPRLRHPTAHSPQPASRSAPAAPAPLPPRRPQPRHASRWAVPSVGEGVTHSSGSPPFQTRRRERRDLRVPSHTPGRERPLRRLRYGAAVTWVPWVPPPLPPLHCGVEHPVPQVWRPARESPCKARGDTRGTDTRIPGRRSCRPAALGAAPPPRRGKFLAALPLPSRAAPLSLSPPLLRGPPPAPRPWCRPARAGRAGGAGVAQPPPRPGPTLRLPRSEPAAPPARPGGDADTAGRQRRQHHVGSGRPRGQPRRGRRPPGPGESLLQGVSVGAEPPGTAGRRGASEAAPRVFGVPGTGSPGRAQALGMP